MNIKNECYLCIFNQVYKIAKRFDEELASRLIREGAKVISKYDLNNMPPIIASEVYEKIRILTGIEDIFKNEKISSIKKALELKPILKRRLDKSKDRLYDALKIAVMGNVIDFGVNREFNLEKELKRVFEVDFAKNDYEKFKEDLKSAKTICYLADNAGENIFDEILIEELDKEVYYVVRGKPIINDVTINDLKGLEIWNLAKVIDSGVDTPGFCLNKANKNALEIFNSADLVISKGMGNFECLNGNTLRDVYYLFKVKCEVVASAAGAKVDDYMFFKGR